MENDLLLLLIGAVLMVGLYVSDLAFTEKVEKLRVKWWKRPFATLKKKAQTGLCIVSAGLFACSGYLDHKTEKERGEQLGGLVRTNGQMHAILLQQTNEIGSLNERIGLLDEGIKRRDEQIKDLERENAEFLMRWRKTAASELDPSLLEREIREEERRRAERVKASTVDTWSPNRPFALGVTRIFTNLIHTYSEKFSLKITNHSEPFPFTLTEGAYVVELSNNREKFTGTLNQDGTMALTATFMGNLTATAEIRPRQHYLVAGRSNSFEVFWVETNRLEKAETTIKYFLGYHLRVCQPDNADMQVP